MDAPSPATGKRSYDFAVVVDSHSPKRPRISSPVSEPTEPDHVENGTIEDTVDSPSTKSSSQSLSPEHDKPPEPESEKTSLTTPEKRPRRTTRNQTRPIDHRLVSVVKGERVRAISTETPHHLQEPFTVQIACQSSQRKDKSFPLCMACSSRQFASGGCKFASLRAFSSNDFTRPMFLDSAPFLGRKQKEAERETEIPYSTPGTVSDLAFLRSNIAPTLISVLCNELAHETIFQDEGLLRRRREAGVRPVCDGCATTIFSGHFMCCCCGREVCLDCYSEWDDFMDVGWENVDTCSRRRRHTKKQMVPFTLFEREELRQLLKDVKSFPLGKDVLGLPRRFPRARTEGFLPFVKTSVDDISESEFQSLWGLGEPVILMGCLKRFKVSWTPKHFIQQYGNDQCMLVNCKTDKTVDTTVGSFFSQFLSRDEPKKPLKLKDWPPADDFAEIFPDLFTDFENALPFPRYTRRKGFMNLASRFPNDLVVPDLGPKMYNAHASDDDEGGQGTTKLHLDITDAVNIMTYSTPNETSISRGGAAVWDIFPVTATNHLRRFLKSTSLLNVDDPVMRQQFYISTPQLEQLKAEYHIVPWRIYQNPGEAVFIPAGCAHQVCNLTSCIKVACDFVSPHCISRCRDLIEGTRRLADVRGGKKEDVLQLKAMMMCAWEEMGRWENKASSELKRK